MKKLVFAWITVITALFFSMPAMAGSSEPTSVSLEGLSADKVKEIQQQVDDARKHAAPELSSMSKAVEVGRMLGAGIVATAREVGVAVNDFAKSDIGRIVTVVLVWKYVGHDILGVGVGLLFLIVGVPVGLRFLRNAYIENIKEEYGISTYFWGLYSRKVVVNREIIRAVHLSDAQGVQALIGGGITVFSVVIGLKCMF